MGDVGSILLGAVFASIVYLASHTFLDFLCMVSFLFPFYADELYTMAVRIKNGENLTQAHRKHVYQLMANERRIAHWRISAGYGALQALVGTCILIVRPFGVTVVLAVLAGFLGLFVVGGHYLRASLGREERRMGAFPSSRDI